MDDQSDAIAQAERLASDQVKVRNRMDTPVEVLWDSKPIVFRPRVEVSIPRYKANHVANKTCFKLDPQSLAVLQSRVAIVGESDTSDLTENDTIQLKPGYIEVPTSFIEAGGDIQKFVAEKSGLPVKATEASSRMSVLEAMVLSQKEKIDKLMGHGAIVPDKEAVNEGEMAEKRGPGRPRLT